LDALLFKEVKKIRVLSSSEPERSIVLIPRYAGPVMKQSYILKIQTEHYLIFQGGIQRLFPGCMIYWQEKRNAENRLVYWICDDSSIIGIRFHGDF